MLLEGRSSNEVALVAADSGQMVTVGEIRARAEAFQQVIGERRLTFLFCDNSLESVRDFVALIEICSPVALLDRCLRQETLEQLICQYQPDLLVNPPSEPPNYKPCVPGVLEGGGGEKPHPQLAVLLSTSGSTGSPRMVRLSATNIEANARQIAKSLSLGPNDRGVTALPLHYSFGMSVVTSHLVSGSSVLVTTRSLLDEVFWRQMSANNVSVLPGVPTSYQMIRRLNFEALRPKTLRALIQAGGRLASNITEHFAKQMEELGGEFFVMYGQTEASPRMACLPPSWLHQKLGSAGIALPGGSFSVVEDGIELPNNRIGEIVYRGPNVMMGYGDSRKDLALGDLCRGVLSTGDIGYLDDDNFLFITGRLKRIAKISGERVSLDELEIWLEQFGKYVALDGGDLGLVLVTAGENQSDIAEIRRATAAFLGVAAAKITVKVIDALPLMPNGKIDYQAILNQTVGSVG